MATTEFECSLCGSKDVTPVTTGFSECKFRVHGIKMSGEQCTSIWTAITEDDNYAVFDSKKQMYWHRLMIESVALDGADGECFLMCLKSMMDPKELKCGHHYHTQSFDKCAHLCRQAAGQLAPLESLPDPEELGPSPPGLPARRRNSLGIRFSDDSDTPPIYPWLHHEPLPGRYNSNGINIEGLCDCHRGSHRVNCKQGYGITEMTTVKA